MIDLRCKNCNKLFAKVVMFIGVIKCSNCKMLFEYNVQSNRLQITNNYDTLAVESPETITD